MKRILVVDDSTFMRTLIKKIVSENGFIVVGEASNGVDALRLYKEMIPDIVTLDITMKEMNGLDTLCEIIKFNPNAIGVMVSALGQEGIIREAIAIGAKGFLVKPFKPEMVINTLKRL